MNIEGITLYPTYLPNGKIATPITIATDPNRITTAAKNRFVLIVRRLALLSIALHFMFEAFLYTLLFYTTSYL